MQVYSKILLILQINWNIYIFMWLSAWIRSFVRSYPVMITSFQLYSWYFYINVFCVVHFIRCHSTLGSFNGFCPCRTLILFYSYLFSFPLKFSFNLSFNFFFFSIVYTVHIAYIRIMYTMHDLQYLCTLYSTSCMHICLCMIKIGTERIDAYDAFQFNHTWNVTHDRNIHHVAHFGDSGIQIAANYDRTRFIENKKLSTIKSHLVIMRQTCCWAYELQFNANLNRNIFFFIRDFNF